MRRLFELIVIVIVVCAGITSAGTILLISDKAPDVAPDNALIAQLESLGYTVDISGMNGTYQAVTNWSSDPAKVAALNNADLVFVSRNCGSGNYSADRKLWNELEKPLMTQMGYLARIDRWGWYNGSFAHAQCAGNLYLDIRHYGEAEAGLPNPMQFLTVAPPGDVDYMTNPSIIGPGSIIGTTFNLGGIDYGFSLDVPAGTNLDSLNSTTDYYGVTGERRVFLSCLNASDYWGQYMTDDYKTLFNQTLAMLMEPPIKNELPKNNTLLVPVDTSDADNDLVFTVYDTNIFEVNIYFGVEGDPNLTTTPLYTENITSVTPGQYTVDLTGYTATLSYETDYFWKVVGYEPNEIPGGHPTAVSGPVWKFTTQAIAPSVSGVSPEHAMVFLGDTETVFSVTGNNVEIYTWYKTGSAAPLVSDDIHYTITTEGDLSGSTLTILDIDAFDVGFYYCVVTKAGFDPVTSDPAGQLVLKELKHYFPFNADDVVEGKTLDTQGGVWGQLMNGATIVPYSEPNSIVGDYLTLNKDLTQYVDLLSFPVFAYEEMTITAWFRAPSFSSWRCLWGTGVDSTNYWEFTPSYAGDQYYKQGKWFFGHDLAMADSKVPSTLTPTRTSGDMVGVYDMTNNQWHFASLTTEKNGSSKLYIDGIFVGGEDLCVLSEVTKTHSYIGQRVSSSTPWDGQIDEVKIYNYVLTNDEVAQEYMAVRTDVPYVCDGENYDIGLKLYAEQSVVYDTGDLDLDNDRQVGLGDLAIIAARWLEDDRIYNKNP